MSPLILALLGGAAVVAVSKKPKTENTKITIPPRLPKGRGLFVDNIESIESFEKILKFVNEFKISWISVLNYEDEKDYITLKKKGILQALSNHDIKIWLWSIPSPYSIDPFIQNAKKYENFKFLSGYIIYLNNDFIKVQNALDVFTSTFKTTYPVGIMTDRKINFGKNKDFFKFDVFQIFGKNSLEPINDFSISIPLYMLGSLHEEKISINLNIPTLGFWNYDELKDDDALRKMIAL